MSFSTTRGAIACRSAIHLIDGRQFDARIKNFDRFAVIVEVDGADQLVFKHAIATIEHAALRRQLLRVARIP